jgi:hypothetical protein
MRLQNNEGTMKVNLPPLNLTKIKNTHLGDEQSRLKDILDVSSIQELVDTILNRQTSYQSGETQKMFVLPDTFTTRDFHILDNTLYDLTKKLAKDHPYGYYSTNHQLCLIDHEKNVFGIKKFFAESIDTIAYFFTMGWTIGFNAGRMLPNIGAPEELGKEYGDIKRGVLKHIVFTEFELVILSLLFSLSLALKYDMLKKWDFPIKKAPDTPAYAFEVSMDTLKKLEQAMINAPKGIVLIRSITEDVLEVLRTIATMGAGNDQYQTTELDHPYIIDRKNMPIFILASQRQNAIHPIQKNRHPINSKKVENYIYSAGKSNSKKQDSKKNTYNDGRWVYLNSINNKKIPINDSIQNFIKNNSMPFDKFYLSDAINTIDPNKLPKLRLLYNNKNSSYDHNKQLVMEGILAINYCLENHWPVKILICGTGTGQGKTSIANVLAEYFKAKTSITHNNKVGLIAHHEKITCGEISQQNTGRCLPKSISCTPIINVFLVTQIILHAYLLNCVGNHLSAQNYSTQDIIDQLRFAVLMWLAWVTTYSVGMYARHNIKENYNFKPNPILNTPNIINDPSMEVQSTTIPENILGHMLRTDGPEHNRQYYELKRHLFSENYDQLRSDTVMGIEDMVESGVIRNIRNARVQIDTPGLFATSNDVKLAKKLTHHDFIVFYIPNDIKNHRNNDPVSPVFTATRNILCHTPTYNGRTFLIPIGDLEAQNTSESQPLTDR